MTFEQLSSYDKALLQGARKLRSATVGKIGVNYIDLADADLNIVGHGMLRGFARLNQKPLPIGKFHNI